MDIGITAIEIWGWRYNNNFGSRLWHYLQMAGNSADCVVINNSVMHLGSNTKYGVSDVRAGICANDEYTYADHEHEIGSREPICGILRMKA